MVIGECPGEVEERLSKVFVGPAGQLLGRMLQAIDVDVYEDVYLCNVAKCRPASASGSGRQNDTPMLEYRQICTKKFLSREMDIIRPKAIIALGKSATIALTGHPTTVTMRRLLGLHPPTTDVKLQDRVLWRTPDNSEDLEWIYAIYHPSMFLHTSSDEQKTIELKRVQWEHLKEIAKLLNQIKG